MPGLPNGYTSATRHVTRRSCDVVSGLPLNGYTSAHHDAYTNGGNVCVEKAALITAAAASILTNDSARHVSSASILTNDVARHLATFDLQHINGFRHSASLDGVDSQVTLSTDAETFDVTRRVCA